MMPNGALDPHDPRPDQKLNAVFAAYRDACPDPEASANFMPELWARIESRRRAALSFRRLSRYFVTGAAIASFALAVLVLNPPRTTSLVYQSTYLETLGDGQGVESAADYADAPGDPDETDLI